MARKKLKWNSEKILSISAMSISFLTLIIFIHQTNLMRTQNALSILPYLATSTTNSSMDHTFQISLKNQGVGPAIIESVIMKYQGKSYDLSAYDDDLYSCLTAIAPELDSLHAFSTATANKGLAIPANETYVILSVIDNEKDYRLLSETLNRLLAEGLDYEIIFKSILHERWRIRNDTEGPESL